MNSSSEGDKVVKQSAITGLIERETGEQIVRVEELPRGANSTVYLAATEGDTRYIVKRYRERQPDAHSNRLNTEFEGLQFLWDNRIRCIPRPICRDTENRIGVYQYIKGRKLHSKEITSDHLGMAADFLKELCLVSQSSDSAMQPMATEACILLQDYVAVVENRYNKLSSLSGDGVTSQLLVFLAKDFTPVFNRAKDVFLEQTITVGLDPSAELPQNKRMLSPSDFGFHNVIMTAEGQLFFIDFEYYGWDDPAKLIADFYLQPSVPLSLELRKYFLHKLEFLTDDDPELIRRLPLAYLFSALKWCLLVLNCFLDCDQEGRCLTGKSLLLEKFDLSNRILRILEEEMNKEIFPFKIG